MATTYTPTALQPGQILTTAQASLITQAANSHSLIRSALFSNYGAQTTVLVQIVRSGGGTFQVLNQTIAAGQTYTSPELINFVLNPGDVLQAAAGAATTIVVFLNGVLF